MLCEEHLSKLFQCCQTSKLTNQIYNFCGEDYGNVYRACGTCDECKLDVYIEDVSVYGGGKIVGINLPTGDVARLNSVCTDAKTPCQLYDGPGDKAGAC